MELLKSWLLLACVAGTFAAPFSQWESRQCSKQTTCNSENVRYETGKTYTYQYHAKSSTWINGTSEQKSELTFDLTAQIGVISPCELTLELQEVDVFETGNDEERTLATNQDALRSELQDHVLRFAFHDGAVTDVCPSASEKTWALNFKRGFLSAIQAPVTVLSEEPLVVTETDVTGKCPAKLTQSVYPGNIMKVKDFKNCEKRTKLEGGIQSTMLRADAPLFNILECSQECEVAFQSNIVSESVCKERHISKPFSGHESGAMTEVRVTVDNLRITDTSKTPLSSMVERQTTILFEHEETETETQEEIIMKTEGILGAISGKMNRQISIEMPNLFSNLVTEMKKIESLSYMERLRDFVEAQNEELVQVFRDALQMTETTSSIEIMVAIMNDVASSGDEVLISAFKPTHAMWLTHPAVIRHPTKDMITSLMHVIKTLSVDDSVFFLPISSMINSYCTSENPSCLQETEVRMAIEYFQHLLGFDCTPTEEVPSLKILMALKALTNIRLLTTDSKIGIINRCFDNPSEGKRTEIRVAALELVRRLPCKPQYQTLALKMYEIHRIDSELRIAAYRAIMTCPSENILAAIKEVMLEETCEQVGSYVWTHLSNLNETNDPQKLSLKKWVQESGIFKAFNKMDPRKFSRNVELSWYKDEMGSGLTLDGDMIFSPQSFLPRQLKVNTTVSLFGYAINLFEVGGRLEGMHQFLEKFFGPRGFFKENTFKDLMEDYQQKQQEAYLNEVSVAETSELPEGLPQGVTLEMYNKLKQLLKFQQKLFGGKVPLPLPGAPMPKGMPEEMTQEMYDELLVIFIRDGVPGERKRRHLVKDSDINNIHENFPSHVEDKPDASMYFKMFGNELGYLDIEKIKARFTEMKSSVNPMKILMNLAKDQSHSLSKNAVLMDGSWTIPTVMGLPLKMAINGTVSMKVRTSGKLDMRGILLAPRSFEINGFIEPSAAVEISTIMEVTARTTRSGLNHVGRLHSSVSLGGKIEITNGKSFELKLNVPEEKQEIIDVSSTIYLRRQDASYEMPGIPERLELSYCSGSVLTKYLGVRMCSELAYPKSYVTQGAPMLPLTGPSRMSVSIEKTDPSLTSWKIEGSYGMDKESVKGVQIITDQFHFMMGAPDTDNARTVQVDFAYNRNEKDMILNIITPFKTVDVHSTVINNEMLRKLELSITMDKTNMWTLDAEVESQPTVVDGDPVITFFPRMDINSPNGVVVKYRSSIAVRDGAQTRVNMWMSLDSPKTALVTVSGDVVKTESTRKLRYSSALQITGRYVNVNVSTAWQKQKRDNIITVDATVLRRVNGEIVKEVNIATKFTNDTTEDGSAWDMKTEWSFGRYPILSFLFETEYTGRTGQSEGTSKLCYRYNGQECNPDTKVVMGHLLTWDSTTESPLIEDMNFKLRNPANNINIEIKQHASCNQSHPLDFSFAIQNNTSEKQMIKAVLSTHIASVEHTKGDFEVALISETWRYAVSQAWEYKEFEKLITNTALHWDDQTATLLVNYIPKYVEEPASEVHNFTSVLTYPLGSLSTNWFVSLKRNNFSHGASMFLINQQLFAYQVDFTKLGTKSSPDTNLRASFNITRPASPISIVLGASHINGDVNGGFNITLGSTKTFASGVKYTFGIGVDSLLKTDSNMFINVEIPSKDFSLALSSTSQVTRSRQDVIHIAIYNGKRVFYQHAVYNFAFDYDTDTLHFTYEFTQNMSHPLTEMDIQFRFHYLIGKVDSQVMVHRNKVPIGFFKVTYDNKALDNTDRHEIKLVLTSPLVLMQNVRWNATLDLSQEDFSFDTRLLYFPDQERPFVVAINFQDKGDEKLTHTDLTVSFETIKRKVTIFNVVKYDLDAGTILGSTSVEFGVHGAPANKFEMAVSYTNSTKQETTTHALDFLLTSPDNTIKTDVVLEYIMGTSISSSVSIAVSENTVLSVSVLARNDSDSAQTWFNVDTTLVLLEHTYRVDAIHNQAANSLNPSVKVYRKDEPEPIAEVDLSYTKASVMGEIHTVILVLKSEDIQPVTISTVYSDRGDTQNVGLDIATAEDENVEFEFNLVTGSSETEALTYDVEFDIRNTYLPGRNLQVTSHFGNSDSGHNVNADVTISDVHMMNLMYTWLVNNPNLDIQITLPQMTACPALSKMVLRLDLINDEQPEIKSHKATFLWGELTDDEMVSLALSTETDLVKVVLTHPMDLEPVPKEITVVLTNNTDTNGRKTFEIQLKDHDINLMMLAGAYGLIDSQENNRRARLTFSRKDHPDIRVTLDMAILHEDIIYSNNLEIKYSEDTDKTVEAMIQVTNTSSSEGTGFDLDVTILHAFTGLDIGTTLNFMNNKKALEINFEGFAELDRVQHPYNLELMWDKELKKYSLTSNIPNNNMVLTGQFEDRSYINHNIYRVTMANSYNDFPEIRSLFEYNSQSKEVLYSVNYNPDQPEDFMRFRAGYVNETALRLLIDSEINGQYTIEASLLDSLQSPDVLRTHLQWRPEWAQFVYEKAAETYVRVQQKLGKSRNATAETQRRLAQSVQMSLDDFLACNADIKTTLVDMKERFDMKVEAKQASLNTLRENLKTKSEEYWEQMSIDMAEYIERLTNVLNQVQERCASVMGDISANADEYVLTTDNRVRTFYKINVKPLLEELKELFSHLGVQHQAQIDMLFPQIHPYGDDMLIPEPEPESMPPQYMTEGGEDAAEEIFLTSIKDAKGMPVITETSLMSTMSRERLRQLELWQSIDNLFTSTKAELDAIIAEWETSFKGSAFYTDLTEKWAELKERFPMEQWREEMAEMVLDIKDSEDVQALTVIFDQIKEEIALSREVTAANIQLAGEKVVSTLKEYDFNIYDYLRYPRYEVLKYDPENGEILFLVRLPYELYSLQKLPDSFRQVETLQRLEDVMNEVRDRSKNTLGEIRMTDGSVRSMFELMFTEPMLLYREGNVSEWFQGEQIKMKRNVWKAVHIAKVYLNPINWIPPHAANGMIVGSNHFMTFDRTFYDFSGGCSYLLAHDFIDGNFTVIVDYERNTPQGDRSKSILLYLNDTEVFEIKKDFTVSHGKQFVELPVQSGRTTIMRYVNSVRIHNTNGITITCDIAQNICNVDINGWYFGKTAGLFGTYNYDSEDDMTNTDKELARHVDDFTRSWKVGRRCSGSSSDSLPDCNSDPLAEANALCAEHFLGNLSSLTQCLGVVDPAPYYAMCTSKMCELTGAEKRRQEACSSMKAYVNECNRQKVGITMPKSCVVCQSPMGNYSQDDSRVLSGAGVVPKSADVIVIVEEKKCNENFREEIADIIDRLDTELKNTRQFVDNRFGLVGFGGEGVHDLPHIHTINGEIFNDKVSLRTLGLLGLEFAEDGSKNTFDAILAAANYPFRAGVAKNIILLSCSDCQRLYHKEKTYTDVASTLMRQGIQFNILMNSNLQLVPTRAKNTSPKNQIIYGIDNRTVFTNKALNSGTLFADKSIRKLINEPVNLCALLAFESGGALFDTSKISEKKFIDVLTQRMVKHTVVEECQKCSCKAYDDGIGRNVCEPCRIADGNSWYFRMMHTMAETEYYSRLGMQTVVDYIGGETAQEPVNKTPKKI